MSELTAFEKANRALISYPNFERVKNLIGISHRLSKDASEPQCIALEGQTGTGKTTLVRDYARAFLRIETPNGTEIPVFYMETPSPVTIKGMAISMLARLGDPAAAKGTSSTLSDRLAYLLVQCKVQLVILDDFHHLIDSDTDRVLSTVSDWLKVLIKETGIPFLVVGIEGKVERILQANGQLSRLFAYRETLEPFAWDESNETTKQVFAMFINTAEESIGMPLQTHLKRSELLHRVYYATDGVVANMMNLLRHGAFLASNKDQTTLDLITLAEAFDTRLSKHLRYKVNPFEDRWGKTFVAPEDKLFNPVEGANNRSRRRKERLPTSGEVLKG